MDAKQPPAGGPGKCGTYAGWNQHQRRDEEPCDPCREANRIYMREYRKDLIRRGLPIQSLRERARGFAMTRLSHLYPEEFEALVEEEMARLKAEARSGRMGG